MEEPNLNLRNKRSSTTIRGANVRATFHQCGHWCSGKAAKPGKKCCTCAHRPKRCDVCRGVARVDSKT